MRKAIAQTSPDERIVRVRIACKPAGGRRLTLCTHRSKVTLLDFEGLSMHSTPSELITIGSLSMRFLVDGRDTSGHMAMAEMIVQPQAKVPPPHRHADVDETIHMLEGALSYRVNEHVRILNAGDHCFSPRGSVHHFSNPGDAPARALVVFSPASIGPDYFREVAGVLGAGGPPNMELMRGVMERHGLELAG